MKKKLKQHSAKHIPDIIDYRCTVTKISNIFNGLDIYLCKFILLLSFLCVMKAPLSGLHVSGSFLIKKKKSESRLLFFSWSILHGRFSRNKTLWLFSVTQLRTSFIDENHFTIFFICFSGKHIYQHGFTVYNQSCVNVSIYQEIISVTNGGIAASHN